MAQIETSGVLSLVRSVSPRKRRFFSWFRLLLGVVIVASISVAYLAFDLFRSEFPVVSILRVRYPEVIPDPSDPRAEPAVVLRNSPPAGWVGLAEIARPAIDAVVVSEDWAFFSHPGYDASQIREALQYDLSKGSFARGASTLTQQVVRNVFLSKEKSLWRKAKELVLAVRLDRAVGKKRILEIYFNIAEWGPGIHGIGPAARHYFSKRPSELTAREGAFLAMLLPSPLRYSQSFRQRSLTPYAQKTMESILAKMVRASLIDVEQARQALSERMAFELDGHPPEI